MENEQVIVPETTSKPLFKLISHIYPADIIPSSKVDDVLGKSKVTNMCTTALALGLITKEKSSISLTEAGKKLGRSIASKDAEMQRKILSECAIANPVLGFVNSLIKDRKLMKNKEIGQKIALKFNKNWKHEASYNRYGTNCGDILAAAGLGYFENGIYSTEKISPIGSSDKLSVPDVGFEKIMKILKELNIKEKTIESLMKSLETGNRLYNELQNCADLNLIKKTGDVYSITEAGKELINPRHNTETVKNIFAEIIRKSPYSKIIVTIIEDDIKDKTKIGQIVAFELGADVKSSGTQESIGKKITNWIKYAGLRDAKPENPNNYPLVEKTKPARNKSYDEKRIQTRIENTKSADSNIVFHIGRLIERIELKQSLGKLSIEDLEELLNICKKDTAMNNYSNLLQSNIEVYKENPDFRIIKSSIDFLKISLGE